MFSALLISLSCNESILRVLRDYERFLEKMDLADLVFFSSVYQNQAQSVIDLHFSVEIYIFSINPSLKFVFADLNGLVGSISYLKPKGPEFESRIRQGSICW
jgi:hypothetical protein